MESIDIPVKQVQEEWSKGTVEAVKNYSTFMRDRLGFPLCLLPEVQGLPPADSDASDWASYSQVWMQSEHVSPDYSIKAGNRKSCLVMTGFHCTLHTALFVYPCCALMFDEDASNFKGQQD
jgi:hypothetical protein